MHTSLKLLLLKSNLPDFFTDSLILPTSLRSYLPLIPKDSATHMHDLAVWLKEGLPFARDLSLENSGDFYLGF